MGTTKTHLHVGRREGRQQRVHGAAQLLRREGGPEEAQGCVQVRVVARRLRQHGAAQQAVHEARHRLQRLHRVKADVRLRMPQ